ncbi:MAG: hypothetical protein WCI81_09470 [Chlorobiaceae bacterium]
MKTGLEITVDPETGSILFYRKNFSGIPEQVLHGEGFTIESSGGEVVMVDIYNADLVLSKLAKEVIESKAS